jgi:C4-dicarboxylate-specific signal transduction histidine kinase
MLAQNLFVCYLLHNHVILVEKKIMAITPRPAFSLNPAAWAISTKVIAVILAVSLTPMLLTAYYNTSNSLDALRDIELRSQRQIADNIAGRIGQILTDTRRTVAYIAAEPILATALEQKKPVTYTSALARMQHYVSTNPDVDLVIIMDKDGTAVVSTEPSALGKNFKFREYFANSVQGRPFMTGMVVGAAQGNTKIYRSYCRG